MEEPLKGREGKESLERKLLGRIWKNNPTKGKNFPRNLFKAFKIIPFMNSRADYKSKGSRYPNERASFWRNIWLWREYNLKIFIKSHLSKFTSNFSSQSISVSFPYWCHLNLGAIYPICRTSRHYSNYCMSSLQSQS